jgi:hypothetical protein
MPEEIIVPGWSVGKEELGNDIPYKKLFFEHHIESALKRAKFFRGALDLVEYECDLSGCKIVRQSLPYGKNNILCKYTRLPAGGSYIPEQINDYRKIIEQIEFQSGPNSTLLQKGRYEIEFKYMGAQRDAEKSIDESYAFFRERAGMKKDRPLKKRKFPGMMFLDFGSKEDKLDLIIELVFQFDILYDFMSRKGTA